MTTEASSRPLRGAVTTTALLAAALAVFQLLVIRVAAVRVHFHYDLLLFANSLLGIGLAAALLAGFERSWRLLPENWARRLCLCFVVSLPLAWGWLIAAPAPESLRFESLGDGLSYLGFAVAAALPFVFGGAAIALNIASNSKCLHTVQGSNLIGAGIACAAAPALLWHAGAGGAFLATVVLAIAATASAGAMDSTIRAVLMLLCAGAGWAMPHSDVVLPIDGPAQITVARGKTMVFAGRPQWSRWTLGGRIDVLPLDPLTLPPAAPTAEGAAAAAPVTVPQHWLAIDGAAGAVLRDCGSRPELVAPLQRTVRATAMQLTQGRKAKVCVLALDGGIDAWLQRSGDAASIRVIESNAAVIAAHREAVAPCSQALLTDPRVEVVHDDCRAALMRSDERFDVIQIGAADTWSSLRSGATAMQPDRLLTVDSLRTLFDRLNEHGILQIARLSGAPEAVRLLLDCWYALAETERGAFPGMVAVIRDRSDDQVAVLFAKGGFAPDVAQRLRTFATDGDFDDWLLPDMDLRVQNEDRQRAVEAATATVSRLDQEIGKRNEGVDDKELQRLRGERDRAAAPLSDLRGRLMMTEFALAADKAEFASNQAYDVSPTTDDRPFFRDFGRRGGNVDASTPAPIAGLDGSDALWRWQLLFGVGAAALFLLLPILFRGGSLGGTRDGALRFLLFFMLQGAGVLGLQIAMAAKLWPLAGGPTESVAVTLASLFVSAGFGSLVSHSLLTWEPQRGRIVAIATFALSVAIALLSPAVVDLCVGLSPGWRAVATALLAAPPGILLGMPLPHGLRVVERVNPSLLPWALAVTVCAMGIGGLGAVFVAMQFGYSALAFGSGLLFVPAFFAIDGLARTEMEPTADAPAEGEGEAEAATE